ncbi:unnamed protein product [Penicillium glandicola]
MIHGSEDQQIWMTYISSCGHVLFRLDKDQGLKFHLSGVGELRPDHRISLPWDENEMTLWNHQTDSQAPSISDFVSGREYPKAFPMHERCWQLMIQILDVELIKKNMDSFVRAMCEPHLVPHTGSVFDGIFVSPEVKEWFVFVSSLEPRFQPVVEIFRAMNEGDPSEKPRGFRGADPLNDPYIQNMIAKYTAKYTKQREKGSKPVSRSSIPTHTMSRRSRAAFKPKNIFLPIELVLNIADHLEHHKDIRTLLLVFPHWHPMIPNSYWRRRFIDDNHLNNDQFPAADALDWQHVYLHTDKLLRPSLGWRNRQHILALLEGTKSRFLQRLEQKNIRD